MTHRQIGGYAAIVQALLWIAFVVFIAGINPQLGITSPADLSNPDVLLPVLHRTPALIIFPALDLIVGISLFLVVFALRELFEASPWMRSAVPFGIGAAFLFIVLATSRLNTLPLLADLYARHAVEAGTQFVLTDRLHTGLTAAIRLMLGLWLLATSVTLRQAWSTLALLSLVAGVVNLVGTFFAPVAGLNMFLFPIWFFSLARWLLSASRNTQPVLE